MTPTIIGLSCGVAGFVLGTLFGHGLATRAVNLLHAEQRALIESLQRTASKL